MAGWSYCPYEMNFFCRRLKRDCDPGIPGCILYGRIEREDVPLPRKRGSRRQGTSEKTGGGASHGEGE